MSSVQVNYPDGRGLHEDPVYFVKEGMKQQILNDATMYGHPDFSLGNSVSFYSPIDGLKSDYTLN